MILVTGGTGLIGSHLLYYLSVRNDRVRAIYRKEEGKNETRFVFNCIDPNDAENYFNKIEWVKADLLDISALENAFTNVNIVYHAGAIVSFDKRDKRSVLKNNVEGTANVVNLSIENGIQKLGYVSSVAAIARQEGKMVDEKDMPEYRQLKNSYSESKFRAEMEVWRGIAEGLNSVIVNPGVVLGYGNYTRSSLKIIQTVKKGLKFYTSGTNGFVDARDVAKMMIVLMDKKEAENQRFILVSENVSYPDLFKMISDGHNVKGPYIRSGKLLSNLAWIGAAMQSILTGKPAFITKDLARVANSHYYYSNNKVREMLNTDFIPLQQTIMDSCRAYKIRTQ